MFEIIFKRNFSNENTYTHDSKTYLLFLVVTIETILKRVHQTTSFDCFGLTFRPITTLKKSPNDSGLVKNITKLPVDNYIIVHA